MTARPTTDGIHDEDTPLIYSRHGGSDGEPSSTSLPAPNTMPTRSRAAERGAPAVSGSQTTHALDARHAREYMHNTLLNKKWWDKRIRYYVPITGWLPRYSPSNLAVDIRAGFMVACLLIPQALSYSSLTHLQPACGLYTALVPALVYAMLGTSRHLSMGPEALVSVLVGMMVNSQLKHLYSAYKPNTPPDQAIDEFSSAAASIVSLVVGVFTFSLGMFRFGFLDSTISESSLRGFITGTAMVILVGQTRIMLGLPPQHSEHSTLWSDLKFMLSNLQNTHVMTAVMSVGTFLFLRAFRLVRRLKGTPKWVQTVPETLVVIMLTTYVSWLAELESKHGIDVFGYVDADLPPLRIPQVPEYVEMKDIISSGITIMAVGVIESVIVAREYAGRNHYAVSSNRELVALGVSNIVGSAFGAYPAFGSLARSKVNDRARATSQVSGMVAVAIVGASLFGLLPYLHTLPLGVLAAIIVDAVVSLLSSTPSTVRFLFRVGAWNDLALLAFICACCFVASVEAGILLAVIISLIMVVKRSNMPRITLLGRSTGNSYEFHPIGSPVARIPRRYSGGSSPSIASLDRAQAGADSYSFHYESSDSEEPQVEHVEGVLIVRIEEPLYFANAGQLHTRLNRLELYGDMRVHPSEEPRMVPTRAVVFDVAGMSDIDGSALEILMGIIKEYRQRQISVAFVRVCARIRDLFLSSGIASLVDNAIGFEDIQDALEYLEESAFE